MTDWQERMSVRRDAFIPDVVWVDSDTADGGLVAVHRATDMQRWQALVDADEPIVTQVDDGLTAPGETGWLPTSSGSQPSVVVEMLDALDVHRGQRVLEIGTGTGWNAALLSDRVGPEGRVVTVEVDETIAATARDALSRAGYAPLVVTADGTAGYPPGAPFDRLIATASVRAIPSAWIGQTRPGGRIVAPWGTDYCNGALITLTVAEDGSATGRCGSDLAFMRLRDQRREFLEPSDDELGASRRSTTSRTITQIVDLLTFSRAAFWIGLRVPACYLVVEELRPDLRRVELHDVRSRSWARVNLVRGATEFEVSQFGPRLLWHEVDAAYTDWLAADRPTPSQATLTVRPDGTHHVDWAPAIA